MLIDKQVKKQVGFVVPVEGARDKLVIGYGNEFVSLWWCRYSVLSDQNEILNWKAGLVSVLVMISRWLIIKFACHSI